MKFIKLKAIYLLPLLLSTITLLVGLNNKGGQVCTLQWSHLCLRNSLKIATRICQFSQYLGTKLDMLFEIAK